MAGAALPAVAVWSGNAREVPAGNGLAVVGSSLLLAVIFWLAWSLVLRSARRGALPAFVTAFLFMVFGRFASSRDEVVVAALVCSMVIVAAAVLAKRLPDRRLAGLERTANVLMAALLVGNAFLIVPSISIGGEATRPIAVDLDGAQSPGRDIYYIVPDRYTGAETLAWRYDFDNSAFVEALRMRGFQVLDDAWANYGKTSHSMASSLNLDYIDAMIDAPTDGASLAPIHARLRDHQVGRILRALGYEYVHVGNWWEPTATSPKATEVRNWAQLGFHLGGRSEFARAFEATTALPAIGEVLRRVNIDTGLLSEEDSQRAHAVYAFDQLDQLARTPAGNRFVLVHLAVPHPPFVFSADGTPIPESEAVANGRDTAYVEQLRYVNDRLLQITDDLLDAPAERQPIIIIQSDEGPHPARLRESGSIDWTTATDAELAEKFSILNALHLPGVEEDLTGLTPVNTWRLIFREYFGVATELLPDRSFVFRDASHYYEFHDVTDRLEGACKPQGCSE